MKKSLLALGMAIAVLGSSAQTAELANPTYISRPLDAQFTSVKIQNASPKANILAKEGQEELSISYTPAAEPYQALGFNNQVPGLKISYAVELTSAVVDNFAGNKITHINFYSGVNNATGTNLITSAEVFATYDLQSTPIATKTTQLTSSPFSYYSVELDTPVLIEAGKPIYVGVSQVTTNANDLILVVDAISHGSDISGGWYGISQNGGATTWNNGASQVGFVCVGVNIAGDNLPKNRVVTDIAQISPRVVANSPFTARLYVTNEAANNVDNIDLTCKINDIELGSFGINFNSPLSFGETGVINLGDLVYPNASDEPVTITFTVSKVNGEENESPEKEASTTLQVLPQGKGYKQNVVIEEFTGTWCGYCPVGIYTMESIRELTDLDYQLIPVAIHVQSDPMVAATYTSVNTYFNDGSYPGSTINRQINVYPYPLSSVLEQTDYLASIPALAKISATAEFSSTKANTLELTAKTEFLYAEENANYAISFGITEDGVGPYNQTNNYSGSNQDIGGWEKKPSTAPTIYNDVARQLNTFRGISNSVPTTIESETEYSYDFSLTLNNKITNTEKINVIAYLIDKSNYKVVNAYMIKSEDIKQSGVEEIGVNTDNNAPVEYYNLQGVRVENPSNGIYIRRQGSSVTKVAIN